MTRGCMKFSNGKIVEWGKVKNEYAKNAYLEDKKFDDGFGKKKAPKYDRAKVNQDTREKVDEAKKELGL